MSRASSSAASSMEEKQHGEQRSDIEKQSIEQGQHSTPNATEQPEEITPWHPSQFPDGGKDAYLCLLGAALCLFCSFGYLNTIGTWTSVYQSNQLRQYSPSTIAWIPSLQIFVMFLPGPVVGFFYDNYGPTGILLFGTFFHVLGLMMTSLCTEYYQFILAQGICSPIGLNCIFQAGTGTIPTWFLKKRGLAYGAMAAGSGLGGVLLPIMANHLIPEIGFAWTLRTIAFLILGLLIIAAFTVKSRLPPKKRALQLNVFLEPFKDLNFVLLVISSFLFFLAIFIPINFIEVIAIKDGMSTRLAGYLLSVLNAASIFGRIFPGAIADKFGKFNMQALFASVSGIIVLALGIPGHNNASHIAFAALYGFASGAYVSLLPAQIAQISKVEQIGVRVGVAFAVISFAGLVGNPIAGAIVVANKGAYWGMNLFAGLMLMAGAAMFIITRFQVAGWKLVAKV